MAVRNDFQVGEVLKSEDLNDTFLSKRSGNANLLYNGAMQVAQRGTSTTGITGSGYYTADRYRHSNSSLGTWTESVENDAPTGTGFRKSLKLLCTTADATPGANNTLTVRQLLEGQDVQRIAKGTSSAQPLTLSFWVKSNVTGTYIAELADGDNTRQVSASYAISSSATWEQKVITFPADTTGVLDNDNATSLSLILHLGAGSDFTSGTLNTVWSSTTNANRAVGQTNLAAATNNYWQVTGVQLEVGPAATAFEFKSFGQELAECQRYYYLHASGIADITTGYYYTATEVHGHVQFPVSMRAAPTGVTVSGTGFYRLLLNAVDDVFNDVLVASSPTVALVYQTANVSGTAGQAGRFMSANAASRLAFSSEL